MYLIIYIIKVNLNNLKNNKKYMHLWKEIVTFILKLIKNLKKLSVINRFNKEWIVTEK